jgi:hypothetical protein
VPHFPARSFGVNRALVVCLTILAASMCGPTSVHADAGEVFLGTWEGEITHNNPRERLRTLRIHSASEDGGNWIVVATYGTTGRPLRAVAVTLVNDSRDHPTIMFVTNAGNPVRLTLIDTKHLVGTIQLRIGRNNPKNFRMILRKAE